MTKNNSLADFGVIGLAVMGENLALNIANHGFHVSVYNRTVPGVEEGVVERFINGRAAGKSIEGHTDITSFVESLSTPRKILMMVRAGAPVDQLMDQLMPLMQPGDILIDGGNSNYRDTNRRVATAAAHGLHFVGCGVSGGEEGALHGPSLMPGGSAAAWPEVKPVLRAIAAQYEDGTPCCDWVGPEGAGHFVKMIHNGIEYGDMQLIAEAYWLMKQVGGMTNEEMADVFDEWNNGRLKSYLVEITAQILRHKKAGETAYLIDEILDAAGQKGTGKWSVINAMDLGMPLGLIASAVFERSLSAQKELRIEAAKLFPLPHHTVDVDRKELVVMVENALYAAKMISYAQGFAVLQEASQHFDWHLDMASIARLWRGGCIIRSAFLNDIAAAYSTDDKPHHLLFAPYFREAITQTLPYWGRLMGLALQSGTGTPALSAAYSYFASLVSENLPANMIQAQRDYFGAHTFERTDRPRGEFHHENWTGHGGSTSSSTYNV